MALIKCPECGKEVSDNARYCQNCGCELSSDQKAPIVEVKSCEFKNDDFTDIYSKGNFVKENKRFLNTLIITGCVVMAVIAVILLVNNTREVTFDKLVSEILEEYPYADNARGDDGSYLKMDTDPYDGDMTYGEEYIYSQKSQDTLNGIKLANEKLGFSKAVYNKMIETTALMGRQTEENDKYIVSWTYHPDKGLEVLYEKK